MASGSWTDPAAHSLSSRPDRTGSHKRDYQKLKDDLEEAFPDQLKITGEGTPNTTGYLEVQIIGGKLLHSKKNGDGYVDTQEKMDRIISGIRAALN